MSLLRSTARSPRRLLRALTWTAGVVPLCGIILAASLSYTDYFDAAREKLWRTLDVLEQHADKVFVVIDVAATVVNDDLLLLSDEEIRARKLALEARFSDLSKRLDEVSNIW